MLKPLESIGGLKETEMDIVVSMPRQLREPAKQGRGKKRGEVTKVQFDPSLTPLLESASGQDFLRPDRFFLVQRGMGRFFVTNLGHASDSQGFKAFMDFSVPPQEFFRIRERFESLGKSPPTKDPDGGSRFTHHTSRFTLT